MEVVDKVKNLFHRDSAFVPFLAVGYSACLAIALTGNNAPEAKKHTSPTHHAAAPATFAVGVMTQPEGVYFTLGNFEVHANMPQDLQPTTSH